MFLPRCMECRRGLAIKILSARLSVRLSNAWIVTKLKKDVSRFSYHTKDNLSYFCEKKNSWWGDPFYLKFGVNRSPLERNRRL